MENKTNNSSSFKKIDTLIYERWFHRILSHWHLFLISLSIAYISSYFYLKYTTKIYTITGSVLVKDASQSINPFESKGIDYSAYARNINLTNEIKIFSSRRLVEETIKNIDWRVTYFLEGTLKMTERYKFDQFKVVFDDTLNQVPYGRFFYLKVLKSGQYELSLKDEDKESTIKFNNPYNFNQEYVINGFRFMIKTNDGKPIYNTNSLFSFRCNNKNDVIIEYASKVRVAQLDKSSSILTISSNGSNIDRELDFINNHCASFIKLSLNDKNISNERSIGFIEKQLDMISDTILLLDEKLSYFRKKYSGTDVEKMAEKRFTKLEEFQEQRAKIDLSNQYFAYLKKYILSKQEYTDIIAPSVYGIDETALPELLSKLMDLKMKQNTTFKVEQNQSPFRIDNENKINQLTKNIMEAIKNLESSNKIKLDDINRRIGQVQNIATSIIENERDYLELKRRYKINEELYNLLLKKKSEMAIIRAGNVSDTKVVDYASVTGAPYPNISKIYTTNFLFALLVPLAYILFKYLTNYRIMERDDVTNVCDMPFLGTIGHIPDNDNMVIINKPKSALSEAFRSIRTNLNFFMPEEDQKVILITSSLSGDGKTFTSLNIASIIAISGKKILLIGADMRKPKVYLDIDTKNSEGLSNYLANKTTLQNIIKQTKIENLFFISSGPVPPNPAELLMSSRTEDLITHLKKEFDYIIIDTPPIGLVSDALTIMKYSDVNIFVVRHDYSQSRYLKELAEHINTGKIKNMCFILNDFDVRKNYGYGYRYGYGYYGSEYGGGYGYGYGYGAKYGYYEEDEKPRKKGFVYKLRKLLRRA